MNDSMARTGDELAGLLAWLRTGDAVTKRRDFTVGTALPDGRLDLCKQDLGPRGAALVSRALRPGPVRHLLLGTNALGDAGAKTAASAVPTANLDTLYLGCNNISSQGACSIADGLRASPQAVNGVWLKRNPLGPGGGAAATGLIEAATRLRTLDLTQTNLSPRAVDELVDALLVAADAGRPITRLYLGGNRLGRTGALGLARLIAAGGIAELFVSAADLGDAGADTLADALTASRGTPNPGRGSAGISDGDTNNGPVPGRSTGDDVVGIGGLSYLSVASNGIGPGAAGRLVTAAIGAGVAMCDLGRVRAAGVLGARDNRLDSGAVTDIANALAAAPHQLAELVLANTGLGDREADLLIHALERAVTASRVIVGKGVARRLKRRLAELGEPAPRWPVPEDVAAIQSVYRTAPESRT